MEQVQTHIEKLKQLSLKFDELNHPEKLETLKSFSNVAKKYEKVILVPQNVSSLNEVVTYLMGQLSLMGPKDVIRKLIIKCINILTNADLIDFRPLVESNLMRFLGNDQQELVGQKLFVLNGYLENVNLGIVCLTQLRYQCLNLFSKWLAQEQNKLKESTAPIVVAKHVQNIQLLFKTLINFLQKCFDSKFTSEDSKKCEKNFKDMFECISMLVDQKKEYFNMELAYLASMAQISMKLLELGNNNLTALIESCLRKYDQNSSVAIDLKDLCLLQAILTIAKGAQIQQESDGVEYFMRILKTILNSPSESNNLSESIAVTRTINFWLIKLVEILNNREETLKVHSSLTDSQFDWFSHLIVFVWSKFDSNIDVVKNTNLQNYKILLSIAKRIKQTQVNSFLEEEINKCMNASWQSNSKLNALIILLESGLSASKIYTNNPNIAFDLMSSISERSTACLVAGLYSNLFKSHRDEALAKGASLDEWAKIWWCPIESVLESDEKLKKTYTYEYLIPRMTRLCAEGILDCERVSKSYASKLIFIKIHRSLNTSTDASSIAIWHGIMENAIVHFDDQVRLDAFGLLCDNLKSTEMIADVEFKLVKRFLEFNSDSMSPSFRQIVIAHLKKLFYRLKESWLFHRRQLNKKAENNFELVDRSYRTFIDWLFGFLFSSLHLDSTFAKRSQSLNTISTLLEIMGGARCVDETSQRVLFDFGTMFDRERMFSLIECLWDTYEVNKDTTIALLDKLDSRLFETNGIMAKDYFRVSIELISSRRPIDSITAVYLMVFIHKKFQLKDVCSDVANVKSLSLFLVKSCLEELESHLKLAKKSLLLAALKKPMYGPLSSIRNLLIHSVNEIRESTSLVLEWREIITYLMDMCFEIAEIVGPIVNSSSPEGIFPKELRSSEPDADERAVTPQMLLVCCWRTMKEVSLFFGDLVRLLPIEFESDSYLLSHNQVTRIGDFFVRLLFDARHLGVFEQTYVGFVNMCDTFWKSKCKTYCEQPSKWLDHILSAIREENLRGKLCSTRRGGGLPCFVQAIVNTELVDFGRKSLRKSMLVLLDLAEQNFERDEQNFSKVLAMYILSALFKDTRIGENVLEYAERALITAINGFDSVFWNVRNASTLLFSSLVNRIFGVNRSKEDISKKNSEVGKIFFNKFPNLYLFFKQVISDSIESIHTHLNAKLYLVALILGHLFTLSDEINDPEACLHAYVPSLLKSFKCPVMKTRTYVAKAIIAIVNLDRYRTLPNDILDMLVTIDNERQDNNKTNGLLILLNRLWDKNDLLKFVEPNVFFARMKKLISNAFDHCAVNWMLILQLLLKSQELFASGSSLFVTAILRATFSIHQPDGRSLAPGAHDLLVTIGHTYCALKCTNSDAVLVDQIGSRLVELIHMTRENSMHLMRGAVGFFKNNRQNPESNRILLDLFKKTALASVLEWKKIDNIHDLKWSCEILVILIGNSESDSQRRQAEIFDNDEDLKTFWKSLLECAHNQTETETRLSVLNLMTFVFDQVFQVCTSNEICLEKIFEILESYLDQNDEAEYLSRFFDRNYRILCAPAKLGHESIRLWDLVVQLLLDPSNEACNTVCVIISRIMCERQNNNRIDHQQTIDEFKKTPSAMIKPTVELIVSIYSSEYAKQTFEFLLEQFELVSECDSNPNSGEEELETVFDKGVDATHSSEIIYLNELAQIIDDLLNKHAKNNDFCDITTSLEKTYRFLESRLTHEMLAYESSLKHMKYNDIKLTKIATHLMFLRLFLKRIEKNNNNNNNNFTKYQKVLENIRDLNFNFYIKNYLE